MARRGTQTAPKADPQPPLPGRRKRRIAEQEQDLLANAAAVKERLKEQRRLAEIRRQQEEQRQKQREDAFFAKRLRERQQSISDIGALGVSALRRANPGTLTQTLNVKQVIGDDSALDYHFLAQRLPLVGIAGAVWLSQQSTSLKRFVWQNIAHLNILNFQALVPDVCTLRTAAPKVQNVQQALQILAINLNGADVNEWVALMTNYSQITGHQVLINLCTALDPTTGSALFPTCAVLKQCLGCRKDPKKNKWLHDLGLSWTEVRDFAARMPSETEQIQTCTTLGQAVMPVGASYRLLHLIQIWLEIPACSVVDLRYLVQNYANLQDKTTITGDMVGRLLGAKLLRATASAVYISSRAKGQTFIFCFPKGRKRIPPEWHIHFEAAGGYKAAKCVGEGWKNKTEKYDLGAKAFNAQGSLPKALSELGLWDPPII
jgi:hypothetical protein